VANPQAADKPAWGWPPEWRIVMTPKRPSNHYPFCVCLIMASTTSIQYYTRGTDEGFQAYRLTHPKSASDNSPPELQSPASPVPKHAPFASDSETERSSLQGEFFNEADDHSVSDSLRTNQNLLSVCLL
jgi:hypothetical protein